MALLKAPTVKVDIAFLLSTTVMWVALTRPLAVNAQTGQACTSTSCLNGGVCTSSGCDCTGTGYTGDQCETVEGTIINCIPEAVAGLSWKPPPGAPVLMSQIARPCIAAFDSLRAGSITRTCTNGTWSPPNYSQCLINTESAFLLLWVPLNITNAMEITSALPALKAELLQMLGLSPPLNLNFVRAVDIGGPKPHISATFSLTLPTTRPSSEIQLVLSETVSTFGEGVRTVGGLPVAMDVSWGVQGFYQSSSCPCRQPTDELFLGLCEEIVPISACQITPNNTFKCFFPYFIGDGDDCTVDEDGDGFPNVPLEICTQLNNTNASYYIQDNCPEHYNPTHDITECVAPPGFDGCLMEEDEVWEISWGNTRRGQTDKQRCPMGPGFMTRFCGPRGWEPAVASGCRSYDFSLLEDDINSAFADEDLDNRLQNSADILQQIRILTAPGRRVSELPSDLDVTNRLINTVLEQLEEIQEGEINVTVPDFGVADILSNILTDTNLNGWLSLQSIAAGSRQLLDISERYGLYLSRTVSDSDRNRRLFQRDNVVIGFKNAIPDADGDQVFPETEEDLNGTFTSIPAQIMIPRAFLREKKRANRSSVPVSTILYRNMELALPVGKNTTRVASMVISGQVSQRDVFNSPALQSDPVIMKFVFDIVENATTGYFCAFWHFSNPVGSGGWRIGGVSMMSQQISSDGQTVTVYCNATHLTSFAVLVDLSGTLNPGDNTTGVDPVELLALQIVSYIGCIISLICLLATIIFFLVLGSELIQKVHYFIHLNLAIVLFLAYLMFVVGVETARANQGACVFVAVWLHYFFLSSFSWMLCEGIMLYLMLVVVFSKLSKRWWFFMIIGYGLPVIPVVVTLGARWSDYGVYGSDGSLQYCWLSTENGVIWAFVGPMLAIIAVNIFFLVVALGTVFRSTRKNVKRKVTVKRESKKSDLKEHHTLFNKLFVATLVLLPLLGVTWVLGIFAVNANTTVFAWLFTIVNSLQGLFIFFFHVLRSDKVWQSSRAKQARASLSRHISSASFAQGTVKRFNLKKTSTSTSLVLSNDPSSTERYAMSATLERSQVDFESTLPDIAEEGVEMQECEPGQSENGRVTCDPGSEESEAMNNVATCSSDNVSDPETVNH